MHQHVCDECMQNVATAAAMTTLCCRQRTSRKRRIRKGSRLAELTSWPVFKVMLVLILLLISFLLFSSRFLLTHKSSTLRLCACWIPLELLFQVESQQRTVTVHESHCTHLNTMTQPLAGGKCSTCNKVPCACSFVELDSCVCLKTPCVCPRKKKKAGDRCHIHFMLMRWRL